VFINRYHQAEDDTDLVGRVTGLDPAGPEFFAGRKFEWKWKLGTKDVEFNFVWKADTNLERERINRDSAEFVDIVRAIYCDNPNHILP
jgi:hypothetical protein